MKEYDLRNKYFDQLLGNSKLKWMGQNTNHIPTHEYVIEAMVESIKNEEFHAYAPPLGLEVLRKKILIDLGLDDYCAMITDGAVSGLFNVCKILCSGRNEMITTDPTWIWPVQFATSTGSSVTQIPIYGNEYEYTLQWDRLEAQITDDTGILYLVDPNNPLGTVINEETASQIGRIAKDHDLIVIHDCTYRDFAEKHTLIANYYPQKTITVCSFSKWLGMAGMRIGVVISSGTMMDEIAKCPPNILGSSLVAQRGAVAGLEIKNEWFPEVNRIQRNNQEKIFNKLIKIDELSMPVYPSQGPFVIIEIDDADIKPEALSYVYSKHNILIRQGSYHTKRFGNKFIKVSLTVPEEWVTEFIDLLSTSVEEAREIKEQAAVKLQLCGLSQG